MKIESKFFPVLVLILLVPLESYGEPAEGSLQIDIKSWGNERVDYHGVSLKVYQDNNVLFKTINSLSGNPDKITLPLEHRYKIEVYVNGMYASVGYVNLKNDNEKLELSMPPPGSIRFIVAYNDGTPISGASLKVKSNDGTYEYWTTSTTDDLGNTIRFWLQPTILNDDYYVAEISVGSNLLYSYYPISIVPGTSRDIKITTPWPSVESLLTVSLYTSPLQTISKSDGDFIVELYDSNKQKITDSKVNSRGQTYFSNLKIGDYIFRVMHMNDNKAEEWGTGNMTVDGKQTSIQIFKNQPVTKNDQSLKMLFAANDTENVIQDTISDVIQTKKTNNDAIKPVVPLWIKNAADWWIHGKISDLEFLKLIEYMVENKIIIIQSVT